MPKSKRAQVVHLTKTTKKTKDRKAKAIEAVRAQIGQRKFCHVIEIFNSDNKNLGAVREQLKPGKLICHRNRVLQFAIGTSRETSAAPSLYKLSGLLTNFSNLLITDESTEELLKRLPAFTEAKKAQPGDIATETVELKAGTEALAHFPISMETQLRSLGLPTTLFDGKIHLQGEHVVCEMGKPLTAEAAKLLSHLEIFMGKFEVVLKASWECTAGAIWLNKEHLQKEKEKRKSTKNGDDMAE